MIQKPLYSVLEIVCKISFLIYFNIYKTAWRFFSLYEIKKILLAHLYSYLIFGVIFLIFREEMSPFARSIIIIDFMLSLVFIVFFRLLKRILLETVLLLVSAFSFTHLTVITVPLQYLFVTVF